jgi:hypothetical protein
MYIHPRATELLPPFGANSNEVPTFNMHEVTGKSEVRRNKKEKLFSPSS